MFGEESGLGGGDFLQAFLGEGEEALELVVAEGGFFAAALDFDEFALAGHDDVEVDLSVFVFQIRNVEEFASAGGRDTVFTPEMDAQAREAALGGWRRALAAARAWAHDTADTP